MWRRLTRRKASGEMGVMRQSSESLKPQRAVRVPQAQHRSSLPTSGKSLQGSLSLLHQPRGTGGAGAPPSLHPRLAGAMLSAPRGLCQGPWAHWSCASGRRTCAARRGGSVTVAAAPRKERAGYFSDVDPSGEAAGGAASRLSAACCNQCARPRRWLRRRRAPSEPAAHIRAGPAGAQLLALEHRPTPRRTVQPRYTR